MEDDRVVLEGNVTRIGEDNGEFTPVTVQLDGVDHRVNVSERFVARSDGP